MRDKYDHGKLYLVPCSWQQVLEDGQRAEDRYDLVDDISVSCVGMADDDDHTPLIGALRGPISKV